MKSVASKLFSEREKAYDMALILYDCPNTTVHDSIYPALSVSIADFLRKCSSCNTKFRYVIEYIFHLKLNQRCRSRILPNSPDNIDSIVELITSSNDNERR